MPLANALIRNVSVTIYGSAANGGAGFKNSYNVFTYQRTTTLNAFSKPQLNVVFQASVVAPMLAAMNIRYTPNFVGIRNIDDPLDAEQTFAAVGIGAIGTDSLPLNSAVYMLLRTALRGRNYRGSKHFGPANEVDTLQDILVTAGLARWQAVRDAIKLNLVDAGGNQWAPTVLSRNLSNLVIGPVAVVTATPITDVLLDLNIGSMKHRRARTIR